MSYDVIIVGCGPVGATAANLLGQTGHKVLVLEQFADAFPLPRAVHLDHEMMRLFQGVGLADKILPQTRETQGHMHLGADGDVIRYMGSVGKPKRFGWANDYFFYQPELEATLREGFQRFANIEFRPGVLVDGVRNTASGCEITAGAETFTARFAIGCDGARSPVRHALGIELHDLLFEEAWLVVDANVDGPISFPPIPSLPEGADPQQLSVMTCDPRRPATIVPGRGAHRRWEFMLLPGESETAIVEPASIHALVDPCLQGCTYEIVRTATYKFNARVAREWRKGHVFLAGDAAHQTPPFFGQGMCHGLRDVSNLAFKLDLVLRGLADDSLLDTYQSERDPQVRHVIGAAVAAGRYICELDPHKAAARDDEIRERQRSGQDIATAADLIAPYTDGLVTEGAGERFIQPRIDGALLDDLTGGGFRLLGQSDGLSAAGEAVIARLGITRFDHPQLTELLNDETVLLRPDNYVFGRAKTSAELETLLHTLNDQLHSTPARVSLHA
ncbi:MAG: bifunctional 3-(3-hydroxy-phenyl)propionate/3-hydroxycinnamic acid hydroxylase [Asticcacaulis sp.]|uniref:bifunctional 3-(3-hydroxy-phenyl)propionate/3-hydroxycinnamic acid hydroxylase n=1 Tax=Asticcacaulis sp. TaxID=1872648 RepID=UPI0039E4D665